MKLSWSQLESLLDKSTSDFVNSRMDIHDYIDDWNSIVEFAGWTWDEFAREIDKRWTPQKKAESPLFRC